MSKVKELIAKTKSLKGRVQGDLGTALVGIESQLQEIAGIVGIKFDSVKEGQKVLEAAPIGSFDYVREKINSALNGMDSFDPDGDGDNDKYNCYVVATFTDRVVIACEDCYYEMSYSIDTDGNVAFGEPIEVEQYFTATESAAFKYKKPQPSLKEKELKESGIEITKAAADMDFETGYINAHIKEGSFNPSTGEVEVVLIEAGTNPLKKRHYPDSTIVECAASFAGMKMYINHQTVKEENERPERDLRDWASTIVESYKGVNKENGRAQALGKIYIHEPWLQERMGDKVWASNVGLSINTGGKISYGKINGEEMQIVEKINPTRTNGSGSVDWVTEAGARGRVLRPIKESAGTQIEEIDMTLKEVTLEKLQAENPELVKKIQESAGNSDTKLAEANRVIQEMQKKEKLRDQKDAIKNMLKESKLPELARARIVEDLQETLFETEDKLKEAVGARIKKELEYVNSISGRGKIKIAANGGDATAGSGDVKEAQKTIEDRFGLNAKQDDSDDE